MKEAKLQIFNIIIVLSLLLLLMISVFLMKRLLDFGYSDAKEHFSQINLILSQDKDLDLSRDTVLLGGLRDAIQNQRSLLTLIVLGDDRQIEYLYTRDHNIAAALPKDNNPLPQFNRLEDTLFQINFSQKLVSSNGEAQLIGSYWSFDREKLFQLFQPLFFILILVFLVLLFHLTSQKDFSPKEKSAVAREVHTAADDLETQVPREQEISLFSPTSGLGWENFLLERLSNELKRAASFEQDLSFALIRGRWQQGSKEYIRAVDLLVSFFPMRDLIFEHDTEGFAIIMPNVKLDSAIQRLENFNLAYKQVFQGDNEFSHYCGVSCRNGRLIEGAVIIKEASAALHKAKAEGESQVIGFRPDPGKFREYLANKR